MKNLLSALIFTIIISFNVMADNHSPQRIADVWIMVPKAGQEEQFEEALKTHLTYRKENGDTRIWSTYRAVTGSNLDQYLVRSCCNTWADQDTYVAWSNENMSEHFGKTVNPYVAKYMHNFHRMDPKNSNWPAGTKYRFVGVTNYILIPGMVGPRNEAIEQMSKLAKDKGWPRNWSWAYAVGGEASWSLATPFENYAAMAPMEKSFYEFATEHMKADDVDAMFDKFSSSFSSASYTIYRKVDDLSMSTDK